MGPVAFMNGAQWKAWNGRLAVSIMGAKNLHVVELNAAGTGIAATIASAFRPTAYARWHRARTAVCMSRWTKAKSGE